MNTTALAYTQYVTALILGAESAFATPQSGATKLQTVLNGIQAATQVGMMVAPNANIAQWTALVNAEVSILNATGLFAKSAPAAALVTTTFTTNEVPPVTGISAQVV